MVEHQLNRPRHRDKALDDDSWRDRDAHTRTTSATVPTYSPSVATFDRCSRRQARSACTSARAVSSEVRHGMRRSTDARRISYPSRRGTPAPLSATGDEVETVFTTSWTWPDWITSTTLGWPSRNFCTVVAGMADSPSRAAVPAVAYSRMPRPWSPLKIGSASSLSASAMEHKAAPSGGNSCIVERNALYWAVGRSCAIPIASPVDFVSGPSTASTAGSLAMEKTGALTAYSGRLGCRPLAKPNSLRERP